MKYSDKNPPLVCMMTNSTCYKGTRKMAVKGVLWHSTGANNPWLKRYVQPSDDAKDRDVWLARLGKNTYGNDWNHVTRQAGLNCWIGKLANGAVTTVQTMPWDYRPWGCASGKKGTCNDGWIQFEICEDDLCHKDYFQKCYREACEITAYLCRKYGINPKGTVKLNGVTVPTILCHWDSYKLGLGSGHSDIYTWFDGFGKSMDDVRKDVAALLAQPEPAPAQPAPAQTQTPAVQPEPEKECETMKYYQTLAEIPEWARTSVEKLTKSGVLKGVDEQGNLNVGEDFCRIITVLDRLGVLD